MQPTRIRPLMLGLGIILPFILLSGLLAILNRSPAGTDRYQVCLWLLSGCLVAQSFINVVLFIYFRRQQHHSQQHEQWFATTLKSIGEAVMTTDQGGVITFMNPVAETLTGWTQAEAMRKEIIFDPTLVESSRENLVIKLGEETCLVNRQGGEIPIEYSGAPIKDTRGNVSGVVLVLRDITERQRAAKALQEAQAELERRVRERTAELAHSNEELRIEIVERKQVEQQLRMLEKALNTMPLGVTITDPAGIILYANPADAAMHGYTVAELLGRDVHLFAPPDRRTQISLAQIEQMHDRVRESRNIRKDQTLFPVHLISSLVKNDAGDTMAIVTTCEDITERKHTEESLVEERNLLRTLIDNLPDYIFIKDREGRFLINNIAHIRFLGVARQEDLRGKTVSDLLPQDVAAQFAADDRQVLSAGQSLINREETGQDAYGNPFWRLATKVPLRNRQDELIGLVEISRDITAYKQAMNRIQHLNMILRAIQNVNQIIVREKQPQRLIQQVCESLTQTRGFHSAWIAVLDDTGTVTKVAESGLGDLFQSLKGALQHGELPACMRQALTQPTARMLAEPSFSCGDCPLQAVHSVSQERIVRLAHADKTYGVLATFLSKASLADTEEQALLEDVAGDLAFALYSIDIEEDRKRAEEQLVHERQRLFDLLENLPVYVYLQLPDTSIRFANRCFRERFGTQKREYYAKLLWGRGELWEDTPTFRVLQTHTPLEWEWDHYPSGKVYQVYDYPFTDSDGSPLVLELGIDITERKQMELALQEERALLAQKVEERTAELSDTNQRLQQEIEERKLIEKELQKSKEAAESANAAKSEFLANMSHELRTPLNAVLGYAQILKTSEGLDQQQLKGLETIKTSGEHLLNLINEVLDLARIEAGRIELELSDFHLPEFLKHLVDMMRIRTEEQGVGFVYEPGDDLPAGVRTDEKKLRQILINLIGNAIKFTAQGHVTLRVRKQSAVGSRQSAVDRQQQLPTASCLLPPANGLLPTADLRFEVEDTGPGIPQDELEEIFLPFQRVGEQQEAIEGTGLGLPISRKLVKIMGGELLVTSVIGIGSRFWFDLALPEVAGVVPCGQAAERKVLGYKGPQRTILIADDRKENRAVMVNMLSPLGFKMVEAENGPDCVARAMDAVPDIILLDLRMPVFDGFEAARQIRGFAPQVVIIAISASVYREVQQRSLQAGCDAFLTKPVQLEAMLHILQTSLQLEWIYEPTQQLPALAESDLSKPAAATLPPEHVSSLLELASKGRVKKLLQQLDDLEQADPQYQPLIGELRGFIKQFRLQDVVARLAEMR